MKAVLTFLRETLELFQFLSRPWTHQAIGPSPAGCRRNSAVTANVRHAVHESPNARNLPAIDLRWRKTGDNRYQAIWIVKL